MRQTQNFKRSRGRGRKGPNHVNRALDSNGPSVRIRGTAAHICEKYQALARDAQTSGDRVSAEGYLQYAEHYYRLMRQAQASYEDASPNAPSSSEGKEENGNAETAPEEANAAPPPSRPRSQNRRTGLRSAPSKNTEKNTVPAAEA